MFPFLFLAVASTAAATVVGPLSGTGWDASAFNVVTLTGGLTAGSDINGRVAVYGVFSDSAGVGNNLNGNTYTETYAAIFNGGVSGAVTVQNGAAWVGTGSTSQITDSSGIYTPPTTPSSDFNFAAARTALDNYSANTLTASSLGQVNLLGTPTQINGQPYQYSISIPSPSTPGPVYVDLNPGYLNVNSLNINYDSTKVTAIVFNVAGTSVTGNLGNLFINGTPILNTGNGGNDFGANRILFNFYQATSVAIQNTFYSSILAPLATLSVGSD
jgi:choice-of-anchor A domain-containing protein